MKMISKKNGLALALSMAVLAGCSSTSEQPGTEVDTSAQQNTGATTGQPGGDGVDQSALPKGPTQQEIYDREQAALREIRTFYFEFDRSDIKPEFRLPLMAHARFLASNPGMKVLIEGHCDERGTKEYNMALGERRAKSLERFLVVNGVASNQIEVLSYGEEQPMDPGHTEDSWSKNRRGVLVYK